MTHRSDHSSQLVSALGWFSLALGVAELVAPRSINRTMGLKAHDGLVRSYGAREIVTGLGLLTQRNATPWIWGRVAGDALDLFSLLYGLSAPQRGLVRRSRSMGWAALAAVGAVTLLDLFAARRSGGGLLPNFSSDDEGRDYSERRGMPRPPADMRGAGLRVEPHEGARPDTHTPSAGL